MIVTILFRFFSFYIMTVFLFQDAIQDTTWHLISINYLEFFCIKNVSFLPHSFIYSIIYVYLFSIDLCIFFFTLSYISIFLYFITQLFHLWPLKDVSVVSCVFFKFYQYRLCLFVFWLLSYSLSQQSIPISACIFSTQVLESAILSRNLVFFVGECY